MSHFLLIYHPLMIRSARSGLEIYNFPKLTVSQCPALIFSRPVFSFRESFPINKPEQQGRRAWQTSGICSFWVSGYRLGRGQNSVDSLISTKPIFRLSSSFNSNEQVSIGFQSYISFNLEAGEILMPSLGAGKYFNAISNSSKANLTLFSALPPQWSVLLFDEVLKNSSTKQPCAPWI